MLVLQLPQIFAFGETVSTPEPASTVRLHHVRILTDRPLRPTQRTTHGSAFTRTTGISEIDMLDVYREGLTDRSYSIEVIVCIMSSCG